MFRIFSKSGSYTDIPFKKKMPWVTERKPPLNILDKPALVAEAHTAIEFTSPSALRKSYRIEDSLDLTVWGTVESGITCNGGQIQRFYFAAIDSTRVLLGVEGRYDPGREAYQPPAPYRTWENV